MLEVSQEKELWQLPPALDVRDLVAVEVEHERRRERHGFPREQVPANALQVLRAPGLEPQHLREIAIGHLEEIALRAHARLPLPTGQLHMASVLRVALGHGNGSQRSRVSRRVPGV